MNRQATRQSKFERAVIKCRRWLSDRRKSNGGRLGPAYVLPSRMATDLALGSADVFVRSNRLETREGKLILHIT